MIVAGRVFDSALRQKVVGETGVTCDATTGQSSKMGGARPGIHRACVSRGPSRVPPTPVAVGSGSGIDTQLAFGSGKLTASSAPPFPCCDSVNVLTGTDQCG